ncbi:hypothetical protein DCCM_3692 [Desulfocucumis palustris]|uniref:Uncharacterized protein n=1 Tax=Desulfocucumis palustris TaxID=1898651 RepID=A0A2L2XFT7_9FIRM|nr:hypothetical protein DCCM_3692 [Desulfocucumis palustris]
MFAIPGKGFPAMTAVQPAVPAGAFLINSDKRGDAFWNIKSA